MAISTEMACATVSSDGSYKNILTRAVALVLKDEGFSLPTVPARRALETAEKLLEWSGDIENKSAWRTFEDELIRSLIACFHDHRSTRKRREQMWENYHKLRASAPFKEMWATLLQQSITREPCPIFYQFVTDTIMEELIKTHFTVEEVQTEHEASLDYEELKALRYTAGYVVKSLTEKIHRSAHPMKKELILHLATITEEHIGCDDETESEQWTNSIDRGGLKHVNSMAFMLFAQMELVLRRHLNSRQANEHSDLRQATTKITSDDDVQFYWIMLAVEWEEEEAQELLRLIVQHWITLRGFSFASAIMEKYKQTHKKSIQKSKGIRKQL